MNIPSLNFDCDYNHKLSCDFFTTIISIHSYFEKNLSLGSNVNILLNSEFQFAASVVEVDSLNLSSFLTPSQRALVSLDTGMDCSDAVTFLKGFLGSDDAVVVTLKKLSHDETSD